MAPMGGEHYPDSDPKDEAQRRLAECGLAPGKIFRHYKGGFYTIVALAIKEDTLEPMIVYQSNAKGTIWARTLADWNERVNMDVEYVLSAGDRQMGRSRFTRVKE